MRKLYDKNYNEKWMRVSEEHFEDEIVVRCGEGEEHKFFISAFKAEIGVLSFLMFLGWKTIPLFHFIEQCSTCITHIHKCVFKCDCVSFTLAFFMSSFPPWNFHRRVISKLPLLFIFILYKTLIYLFSIWAPLASCLDVRERAQVKFA